MKSRPCRVESSVQAELLMDRAWTRLLGAFMDEARGIAEAARSLGVSTEWLYPRVRRLERAGLLAAVEVRPRAGRAVRLYRATAGAYFVPFSVVSPAQVGRQSRAQHLELFESALHRTFSRPPFDTQGWGFVTERSAGGDVSFRIMRDDGLRWADLGAQAPVMVSGWHLVHLGPQDALALQADLRALHERYSTCCGEPYLLGIFLADTANVPGLEHAPTSTEPKR
ncbi:hypothetical protein [Deinococcus ficus]|uniref:hypothetical protein n=1 Tax=Deinococcus ficus TaxID=317577 RepID=UPI00131D0E74|nr:hypothetical protein [Deinococcus ficus]